MHTIFTITTIYTTTVVFCSLGMATTVWSHTCSIVINFSSHSYNTPVNFGMPRAQYLQGFIKSQEYCHHQVCTMDRLLVSISRNGTFHFDLAVPFIDRWCVMHMLHQRKTYITKSHFGPCWARLAWNETCWKDQSMSILMANKIECQQIPQNCVTKKYYTNSNNALQTSQDTLSIVVSCLMGWVIRLGIVFII